MDELNITVLVDVRTLPFSRWQPDFSMPALRKRLGESYPWPKDLGRFGDKITEESLDWLVEFGRSRNIVIMCSERDPAKRHRHSKIATRLWLQSEPVPMIHLRRDGTSLRRRGSKGDSSTRSSQRTCCPSCSTQ